MIIECACFVTICIDIFVVSTERETNFGTTLYTLSDVNRIWTDNERIELQSRLLIEHLVPTTAPENENDFLNYFDSIKNTLHKKIDSVVGRKFAMVMVADAIGGYLYAKMLPEVRLLYYEGKSKYSTTKRLHDLMKKIKYVLGTDGRGWARPVAAERGVRTNVAAASVAPEESTLSCGGVDAGQYGLLRKRTPDDDDNGGDDFVPYFDNDTRPHSLVVPWRPRRGVLYTVRDAGCHRVLYDYCARSAVRGHHDTALRTWMNVTVRRLVSPKAATARWYPALWAASLAARRLDETAGATDADAGDDDDGVRYDRYGQPWPNHNFFAFVVLISGTVCWSVIVCALFGRRWVQSLCSFFGKMLCIRSADSKNESN